MSIRVVLADDHELMRKGIAAVVSRIDGVDLVAECGDLPSLRAAVAEHTPDVVVTDIRMPPTGTDEGIVAAREIRETRPNTGVVVLSQYAEPEYVLDLFAEGSDGLGYLLKDSVDVDGLARAVRSVAEGGSAVDGSIVELLVQSQFGRESALDRLTDREREVLAAIAEGLNNAAVAERLVLSPKAVSNHINSIFAKLDLAADDGGQPRVKAVLMWLSR